MGQGFDRSPVSKLVSARRSDNKVKKVLADFDWVTLPRYCPSLGTFRTQFSEVITEARPWFTNVSDKSVFDVYFIVT